jgi:hypothetical protein
MATAGTPIGPQFDIPDFTISGILPPFQGPSPVVAALMSPYQTTLSRIATKLCVSNERRNIFRGLLAYRQQLNAIGLSVGFQWLSGSFMEDIETLEARSPNDVDVVTFCHRPPAISSDAAWQTFTDTNIALIDAPLVKATFMCDAYFVDLDITPLSVVDQTRYWFGLFSHRRGGLWKGMLQVPLTVTNDDADASILVEP